MGHRETVLGMIGDGKLVKAQDLREARIPTVVLSRMVESGELELVERGVYRSPVTAGDETSMRIAGFSARYPGCLVCLVSAARYHRLTDDMHSDWTIAVKTKSAFRLPEGLRMHRWLSPSAHETGVHTVVIGGIEVRMTDPARTVADMIRSRNGQPTEHALGAYAAFLASGGEPEEVSRHARVLGFAGEVSYLTPLARRILDAGAFTPGMRP